jgi:hypothetical protein
MPPLCLPLNMKNIDDYMPAPHRIGYTYHDFRGNKINDYALKSCIFFKDNGLWITGSSREKPRLFLDSSLAITGEIGATLSAI